jgi:hypothetical protein
LCAEERHLLFFSEEKVSHQIKSKQISCVKLRMVIYINEIQLVSFLQILHDALFGNLRQKNQIINTLPFYQTLRFELGICLAQKKDNKNQWQIFT